MDQVAAQLLPQQVSIVFDGIHLAYKDRQAVRQLASEHLADAHLIYVVADPEIIERRLQARMQSADQTAAEGKFVITLEHFTRIVSYLESPADDEPVIWVDTSQHDLDEQLDPLNRQLQQCLVGQ
jgi:2-phosphoglycerate kinase